MWVRPAAGDGADVDQDGDLCGLEGGDQGREGEGAMADGVDGFVMASGLGGEEVGG